MGVSSSSFPPPPLSNPLPPHPSRKMEVHGWAPEGIRHTRGEGGGEPAGLSLEMIELGSHLPQLSSRQPVCRSYFVVVTLCIGWRGGVAKAGCEKGLDAKSERAGLREEGGESSPLFVCPPRVTHTHTYTQHKHNTHTHTAIPPFPPPSLPVGSFHCTSEADRVFSYLFPPPLVTSLSFSLLSSSLLLPHTPYYFQLFCVHYINNPILSPTNSNSFLPRSSLILQQLLIPSLPPRISGTKQQPNVRALSLST